jgi:choloylglycine hydrolase
VGPATFGPWGIVPPVHYFLEDTSGKSIVIEYVDGVAHVYDDAFGVLTNAPGFDWHMTNLRNYINLSPDPQATLTLDNVTLDPLSTGGNLFGLPGDFSSPARFVRAVVYSHLMPQAATGADAAMQGFHILDNFDIPQGSVPEPKGSNPPYEITEWTTMSDLQHRTFYIWTYDNRAIRTLDLTKLDLTGSAIETFPLDQQPGVVPLAG